MIESKELKRIVTGFRKGLLSGESPVSMCYAVCAPLSGYLSFIKVDNVLTEGEINIGDDIYGHYWLTMPNGDIIDPTADQFNQLLGVNMPKVYIGAKPDYYLTGKEIQIEL